MTVRLLAAVLLLLMLDACGSNEPSEGVLAAPPTFPGSAGATAWIEAAEVPPPYGLDGEGFASADDLLAAVVREFSSQGSPMQPYLLGPDGRGGMIAIVHAVQAGDDSVAGQEVQLSLRPGDDGRWRVIGARSRTHCRRGASDDVCL